MKKIVMVLALFIATTAAMAQKAERTNAFMYNKNGQYDKARESIDKAILNEKTILDPKTWMYRGIIYLNIVFSDQYKTIDAEALPKSLESFKKAMELDPEDKENQMLDILPRINAISQQYFSIGVEKFNAQDFALAADHFIKAYDVAGLIKSVDTMAIENAALASLRGENYAKAIEYYGIMQGLGVEKPDIYKNIAMAQRSLGDNEGMKKTIEAGRLKFPEDSGLLLEEINSYLALGQGAKVVDDLKNLVRIDSTNYSIYFVLGTIYGDDTKTDMYQMDMAVEYYKKAIAIKPDYFDAIYNLGALYINESNKLQMKANDLPLTETKKYDEITEQANVIIRAALPYLETAYQMDPSNQETVMVLKSIYTRFKMNDKLELLNK
ncbi:MAG: tetratricopeptide repeat protein [Bacteroidales bacterium]|nr:tetratricopeptide repeat protein [Bacteroidales bacterium]